MLQNMGRGCVNVYGIFANDVFVVYTKKVPFQSMKWHLFLERTGDRTLDPQIKSLLLYQLSYPPDAR